MNTEHITSPAPGWFRVEVTPTSIMTEAGHFVVGESILIPVGPNQITPADLISMAISAAGRAAIPDLIKSLEALIEPADETAKRKRASKSEAGKPSTEQVPAPIPPLLQIDGEGNVTLATISTTEGGAE